MTTILFDSTRVKTTRNRLFGIGLSRPGVRRERVRPSAADLAWADANLNANTTQYEVIGQADSVIDQAAGEAGALTAMEAGYAPF